MFLFTFLAQTKPGQASESSDAVFLLLLLLIVGAGAGLVIWSRKRGERKAEALASRRRSEPQVIDDSIEEPEPEPAPLPVQQVSQPQEATAARPELVPVPKVKTDEPFRVDTSAMRRGLEKTRTQGFVGRLAGVFRRGLDQNLETQIEEVLLTSDIGVRTAQSLLASIKESLGRADLRSPDVVWTALRSRIEEMLASAPQPPALASDGPQVIAVVGVNGTGKTTTIGKLAHHYVSMGKKVLVVAADTFRAAAGEQLNIWAQRVSAEFFDGPENRDPASVAFDGIKHGLQSGADIIIIDTAGRLHTNKNLVEELKKMVKVCGKALAGAPHQTLLVLDATIGQNAIAQAQTFTDGIGVNGIVLTKLDGTAKGGVIIGIADVLHLPVLYVGIGEKMEDLRPFSPAGFVDALFSIQQDSDSHPET